jgi:hypothetical protein
MNASRSFGNVVAAFGRSTIILDFQPSERDRRALVAEESKDSWMPSKLENWTKGSMLFEVVCFHPALRAWVARSLGLLTAVVLLL